MVFSLTLSLFLSFFSLSFYNVHILPLSPLLTFPSIHTHLSEYIVGMRCRNMKGRNPFIALNHLGDFSSFSIPSFLSICLPLSLSLPPSPFLSVV